MDHHRPPPAPPRRATRDAARRGQLANRPEADERLRIRRPVDRTRLLRRDYSARAPEHAAEASGVGCRTPIRRRTCRRGLRADAGARWQAGASVGLELSDTRGTRGDWPDGLGGVEVARRRTRGIPRSRRLAPGSNSEPDSPIWLPPAAQP